MRINTHYGQTESFHKIKQLKITGLEVYTPAFGFHCKDCFQFQYHVPGYQISKLTEQNVVTHDYYIEYVYSTEIKYIISNYIYIYIYIYMGHSI